LWLNHTQKLAALKVLEKDAFFKNLNREDTCLWVGEDFKNVRMGRIDGDTPWYLERRNVMQHCVL
jgi:hypothetical protein